MDDERIPPDDLGGAMPASQYEVLRVRTFLQQAAHSAAERDDQLRAALAKISRLEEENQAAKQKLEADAVALERSHREIERLQQEYTTALKDTAKQTADLTADFVRQRFAGQLEEIRSEVAAHYSARCEQMESLSANRSALFEERIRRLETALQDKTSLLQQANAALESLRQSSDHWRDAIDQQLQEVQSRLEGSWQARVTHLEATLQEKEQLINRANDVVETLQGELQRNRERARLELQDLQEDLRAKQEHYSEHVAQLQSQCETLQAQVDLLQETLDESEDTRNFRTLKEQYDELRTHVDGTTKRHQRFEQALMAIKRACTKSVAARSILKDSVDLDKLFAELD